VREASRSRRGPARHTAPAFVSYEYGSPAPPPFERRSGRASSLRTGRLWSAGEIASPSSAIGPFRRSARVLLTIGPRSLAPPSRSSSPTSSSIQRQRLTSSCSPATWDKSSLHVGTNRSCMAYARRREWRTTPLSELGATPYCAIPQSPRLRLLARCEGHTTVGDARSALTGACG